MQPIGRLLQSNGRLSGRAGGGQERGDGAAQRPPGCGCVAGGRNAGCKFQDHGDDDRNYEAVDHDGVGRVRPAEARHAQDQALVCRQQDDDEQQHRKQVLQGGDPAVAADRRQGEAREKTRPERVHDGREEDEETGEYEGVKRSAKAYPEQAAMQADRNGHARETFSCPVETRFGRGKEQRPQDPVEASQENPDTHRGNDREDCGLVPHDGSPSCHRGEQRHHRLPVALTRPRGDCLEQRQSREHRKPHRNARRRRWELSDRC